MRAAILSVALHAVAIAGLVVVDEAPTPAPETIEITVALLPPEPARKPAPKPVAEEQTVQPASPPPAPQPAARAPARSRPGPAAAPRPSPAPPPAAIVAASTADATAAVQSSAAASLGVGEAAPATEVAALPATGPTRDAQYQLGAADTPLPDYPWSARRRNREGRVVVRLTVTADGSVQSAEVVESSGDAALDGAARDTLSKWRLRPALNNGIPVTSHIDVPIRFELRQQGRM